MSAFGEPVEAHQMEDPLWCVSRVTGKFDVICVSCQKDDERNMRRIAGCLNACAGLTDEEVVAMRELWDRIQKVAAMGPSDLKVMPKDVLPERSKA